MKSLSIVKTLVVLFYVGHISSWALKLPAASGDSLNRNTRQLVTCPGFAGYCSEAYPGDTCTVVCAFGRNNVPECQPDGTWSDIPRCIEHEPGLEEQRTKICPGVPGYCSDSNIGTLCEFDCLIGADIRSVCNEDGTWGPYPTCQGDIRETRDGCDGCPGPFGGPRNRAKEGGSSGKSNGRKKTNGNSGGRKSQNNGRNHSESPRRSGNGGNRRNGVSTGNRRNQGNGGNRRNGAGKKKNGGGARTAAEELAAKAGGVVPGKLPQGRRPPKPKNFDALLQGNKKFISNGNSQPKNNSNVRKNNNGNGRRNKPKSNGNGNRKNSNGSSNKRPSNNKRPKSISNNGSKRNQNNGSKRNQNKNGRPSNNRKQNRNNNFGQRNKGGSSNQKRKNNRPAKKQTPPPVQKKQPTNSNSGACSEAALEACISACPANIFAVCANGCANSKLIGCESQKQ